MALTFDYAPGMSLTDPWVFTNSRATTGTFWDSLGIVRTAAAGVTRDRHYPLGPVDGRRTTLLEIGSTNSGLWSQDFSNAVWTPVNQTATANAAAAPDLTVTASRLIPDTASVSNHRTRQQITVTANENLAMSAFLKAEGYSGARIRLVDSSGVNAIHASIDLLTGAILESAIEGSTAPIPVLTGSTIVPLGNGWYWVGLWGSVGGGFTLVQHQVHGFQTGAQAAAATAFAGNGTSGILAWGAQHERWGAAITSPPTSYIATTTLTVARGADSASTPWPFQTMPMWGYAKLIDLGWAQRAGFSRLVTLSNAAGAAPRFTIMTGVTSAGFAPGVYRHNYNTDFAVQSAATIASAVRGYGTPIELFWRLFADQLAEISLSVNGGAVVTATSGGGSKLLDFITPTVLIIGASLNEGAQVGLQRLKLGAGTAPVTTLALAAAA